MYGYAIIMVDRTMYVKEILVDWRLQLFGIHEFQWMVFPLRGGLGKCNSYLSWFLSKGDCSFSLGVV